MGSMEPHIHYGFMGPESPSMHSPPLPVTAAGAVRGKHQGRARGHTDLKSHHYFCQRVKVTYKPTEREFNGHRVETASAFTLNYFIF